MECDDVSDVECVNVGCCDVIICDVPLRDGLRRKLAYLTSEKEIGRSRLVGFFKTAPVALETGCPVVL